MHRRRFLQYLAACGSGWALFPGVCFSAPDVESGHISRTKLMMGTFVSITVAGLSRSLAEEAIGRAFTEMERLVRIYDRHDPDSALTSLNKNGMLTEAPAPLALLLRACRSYYALTKGYFDPTVQPLVQASLNGGDVADFKELLPLIGMDHLDIAQDRIGFARKGMGLTLDGVAKGEVVDQGGAALAAAGAANFLINAGGDILARGSAARDRSWLVGIQGPNPEGLTGEKVRLDGAIATSGTYEMRFDQIMENSHLVRPDGKVAHGLISATVMTKTTRNADALATAACVMGPRRGLAFLEQLPGVSGMMISGADGIKRTANWG